MRRSLFLNNRYFPAIIVLAMGSVLLNSCKSNKQGAGRPAMSSNAIIDSLKHSSDSSYSKPYFTRDFATAEYYLNRSDSTVAQVMKDKDSVVRQLIITKGKVRVVLAQYYANGQLIEHTALDGFGQPDGDAAEYYMNGTVHRSGNYRSGLHEGKWKNFDSSGRYMFTEMYNQDGQVTGKTTE